MGKSERVRQNATNIRRVRPPLACLSCNHGKKKCDKQWPVCSKCKALGRVCTWDSRRYGPNGLLPKQGRHRGKEEGADSAEYEEEAEAFGPCIADESMATIEHPACNNTSLDSGEKSMVGYGGSSTKVESARLCTFNNFLLSVSRVCPMNDVLTVPPTATEDLKGLHDLWRLYVGMERNEMVMYVNTSLERQAFYNSFRAIVCFAHACVYLNYHTALTLSERMAGVAAYMFSLAVGSFWGHPDDTISCEMVGAFAVMARVRDIARKEDADLIDTTFRSLGVLIDERSLLDTCGDYPDLYSVCLVTDLLGRRCGVIDALKKATVLRQRMLEYMYKIECEHDFWRGTVLFTQLSLNVLTTYVLAEVPNGEMSCAFCLKPFSSLPDDIKVLCLGMHDDLKGLINLLQKYPKPAEIEQCNSLYLITHATYPFFHFLELYMGIATSSRETMVQNVIKTIEITCHNSTVHEHPLNTGGYCAVTFALAVLALLSTSDLERALFERSLLSSITADKSLLNKKGRALLGICKDLMLSSGSKVHILPSGDHLI